VRHSCTVSLTFMLVGGWVFSHTQTALLWGLRAGTHCTESQVGLGAGLDGYKKSCYS